MNNSTTLKFKPTTKDLFVKKIASEIFNYRKDFGVLTFCVKFNSGVASSLIINTEEKINLSTLHKTKLRSDISSSTENKNE